MFKEFVYFMNNILWNYVLVIGLIGVGIYMTIKLKFPQFTRLMPALKKMIKSIVNKEKTEEGKMTPFQALSTAVAAQVGTGNIVGVATAIGAGGPGAAFWMLISAFFGMATIFSEAVLAQKYRETRDGELVGGPAYYIKNGLKSKTFAMIFSITAVIVLGFVGTMVQSNSVVKSISASFSVPPISVTIGLTIVVALILMGGMKRIASFAETVVPIMAVTYIGASLIIIIMNIGNLIPAIKSIFVGAFSPQAIGGGALGITVQQTVRFGLARGLFSNEAGIGSTPHSHAVADTKHPADQGFMAMIGVFISTFLICVSTVLVNLTSGSYDPTISAAQMTESSTIMTQGGFAAGFGAFGEMFLSVCLSFFSLTTIIGWYFFAESNVKNLVKTTPLKLNVFKVLVLITLVIGAFIDPTFVWEINDMSVGIMAVQNIIALVLLSKEVKYILDDYDAKTLQGNVYWKYEYQDLGEGKKKASKKKQGKKLVLEPDYKK